MRAAVFDLDNTLIRGSSLYHFATFLVRRRIVSVRHVAPFVLRHRRYTRGMALPDEGVARATSVALGLVAGDSRASWERLANDFVSAQGERHLDGGMLAALRGEQQRGVPCFLATAGPQELASAYSRHLNMTGAVGSLAEVVDGRYTGRLLEAPCRGAVRARRVQSTLASLNADVSAASVYSSSVGNLPLLVAAGRPVAVDPDDELKAIAEANGWTVIPGGRGESRAVLGALANLPFPM